MGRMEGSYVSKQESGRRQVQVRWVGRNGSDLGRRDLAWRLSQQLKARSDRVDKDVRLQAGP